MSTITKLLFTTSEKGNPMCKLWVDEADTSKDSEAIYTAIKSQVAYLFFLNVGSEITLKKSKQYYNVEVPDNFTAFFEGYKTNPNDTVKLIGGMLNRAFDNAFNSIEFLKNGEVTSISQDECNSICSEYLNGYFALYNNVLENLDKSNNKALKSVAKVLNSETSKPAEIKDANHVVLNYVGILNNHLNKQHLKVV